MTTETMEIVTRIDGSVGRVTLNRPKAINALTHGMVTELHNVLTAWADDPTITAVVLDGAGERGLCAGGDIVAIYHDAREGGAKTRRFWFDEYRLNAFIASYPKPCVSLMDGLVMGGGVGVGAHANVRVVTEKSKIAMPEVGIGFIPDVGGSYLLCRAPGLTGLHVGLTGAPINGADAIALGFADHFIPRNKLGDLTAAIVTGSVDAAITAYAQQPPSSELAEQLWIDECYDHGTVADIIAALRAHDAAPANEAGNLIASRSPIALAVTLESVRRAANIGSLNEVLVQEYRVSCAGLASHDFVEGIRAQVIDKDRDPKWIPSTLAAVSARDVEAYFKPLATDLVFDSHPAREAISTVKVSSTAPRSASSVN